MEKLMQSQWDEVSRNDKTIILDAVGNNDKVLAKKASPMSKTTKNTQLANVYHFIDPLDDGNDVVVFTQDKEVAAVYSSLSGGVYDAIIKFLFEQNEPMYAAMLLSHYGIAFDYEKCLAKEEDKQVLVWHKFNKTFLTDESFEVMSFRTYDDAKTFIADNKISGVSIVKL